MVSQTKIYQGRVISPEQGRAYPTMELGQTQEIRLLKAYVEGAMERIRVVLGQFLRSVGCIRVEANEWEYRELSAEEQAQWVWCVASAPLNKRTRKMFRFGMPSAAVIAMTETTLGVKPGISSDRLDEPSPSETEWRFLNRLGHAITQGVIAENIGLLALDWQQQPSDMPTKKGLCLTMQLVFQDRSWPLTLHWNMAFAELLETVSDRTSPVPPFTRAQLEASLEKIPVQLKTTLLSAKLTMADLDLLLQGEILPVSPLERMTLGCGNLSMGVGKLYGRNGHLVFQLHDMSQQTT